MQTKVCILFGDDFMKLHRAKINSGMQQRDADTRPRIS